MDARDTFIRGVWSIIDSVGTEEVIERLSQQPRDDKPLGDFGEIIRAIEQAGVDRATLARFARLVSYETAFGLLYQLSDPKVAMDAAEPSDAKVSWELFETDPVSVTPGEPMSGLHESVLSADTEGDEMRPPNK